MKINFFGTSLLSSYWNGAATYYRGILKQLHKRGHEVTFFEPDILNRKAFRDFEEVPYAACTVYAADTECQVRETVRSMGSCDVIVVTSGLGPEGHFLNHVVLEQVLAASPSGARKVFWDVDAPATLAKLESGHDETLAEAIPRCDFVFTYGGGEKILQRYKAYGAKECVVIYNALDPEIHHPVSPDPLFAGRLGLLANWLPDRAARIEEFFFKPVQLQPSHSFILGGCGWEERVASLSSVQYVGHVPTGQHNRFNSSMDFILNVNRESMATNGFSPATRVFEAGGAEACLITDSWEGIELFLDPGSECLVAASGEEVSAILETISPERAQEIGMAARRRLLSQHTYQHRAQQIEEALDIGPLRPRVLSQATHASEEGERAKSPLRMCFIGLSLSSSWGNGHATTYRCLLKALARRGHDVTFFEFDAEYYRQHRDLANPSFCDLRFYGSPQELFERYGDTLRDADVVVVGSFVASGREVGHWVVENARGATAFYDIDTPRTFEDLGKGECSYLSPELASSYDLYLSFTGGPLLEQLSESFQIQRPHPLFCAVDPDLYSPATSQPMYDLGYLGTYSADRQKSLETLLLKPAAALESKRFIIAGPQYPLTDSWPPNVTHREHYAPDEHRSFYTSQRFTLNITRGAMRRAGYSPSVRLFEAAACGVPIISDRWKGIETFFEPDAEILLVSSSAEVVSLLTTLPEEQRTKIGEQARQRVLQEHTGSSRAAELEYYLSTIFSGSRYETASVANA